MNPEDGGRTDFIVVGSGIAGLYTAIHLADFGRVTVISKQGLCAGNTRFAQGGVAAAFSAEDSPELHLEDTWRAGGGFGDRAAISVLVREAPEVIADLIRRGIHFDSRNGAVDLGREGAHSRNRIWHIGGDATGKALLKALLREAKKKKIHFLENAFVERLIVGEDGCRGVCFFAGRQSFLLRAGAVIMASGGCGQVYRYSTGAGEVTGDGLAMAFWAGAVLRDLEFFQFHPTVFFPPRDAPFLITEAVRGEGAYLVNHGGDRFAANYHPLGELGPRDVLSRAILMEQSRNGRPVYLDLRHLGAAFIRDRFPTVYRRCLGWGLDITCERIPVSPAAHYLVGGIEVDLEGRTSVRNLFAVGEVASTGVHGANRLASNSLLEGLVFGRRVAGAAAAACVRDRAGGRENKSLPEVDRGESTPGQDSACRAVRPLLQKLLWENVGLIRNASGLESALAQLKQWLPLLNRRFINRSLCETQNMILLGTMMAGAAAARCESRGCHYRADFPESDPRFQGTHLIFQNQVKDAGNLTDEYLQARYVSSINGTGSE